VPGGDQCRRPAFGPCAVVHVADRIHIQWLGRCAGIVTSRTHTMEEAVAIMTGASVLEPSS
jgi:fructose transport system ATP-binding protein